MQFGSTLARVTPGTAPARAYSLQRLLRTVLRARPGYARARSICAARHARRSVRRSRRTRERSTRRTRADRRRSLVHGQHPRRADAARRGHQMDRLPRCASRSFGVMSITALHARSPTRRRNSWRPGRSRGASIGSTSGAMPVARIVPRHTVRSSIASSAAALVGVPSGPRGRSALASRMVTGSTSVPCAGRARGSSGGAAQATRKSTSAPDEVFIPPSMPSRARKRSDRGRRESGRPRPRPGSGVPPTKPGRASLRGAGSTRRSPPPRTRRAGPAYGCTPRCAGCRVGVHHARQGTRSTRPARHGL